MTDRMNGVTVTFDRDIREDDAEILIQAISMIKGVIHVEPNIVMPESYNAKMQMKIEIRDKLYTFIKSELNL